MQKALFAVIATILVVGLAIFFIGSMLIPGGDTGTGDAEQIEQTGQDTQPEPNGWQTYENEALGLAFQHPPEALVDVSNPAIEGAPSRVRVRVIGPENPPNSEITDGFIWYAHVADTADSADTADTAAGETLQEAAQRTFDEISRQDEVLQELRQTERNGKDAYRFSIRSRLGSEIEYLIIEDAGGSVFVVSYGVSIPDGTERDYAETIERMTDTLAGR